MTDTIEAVAMDAAATFLEQWEPGPEMTVVKLARAFAAYAAAHTKALIEGAGELVTRLRARARLTDLQANQDAFLEAAATIAAQKAEIERLEPYVEAFRREERRADDLAQKAEDAKLDGVRAGIEASAGQVYEHGNAWGLSYRTMTDQIANAIRALDAEAIAKGEG